MTARRAVKGGASASLAYFLLVFSIAQEDQIDRK